MFRANMHVPNGLCIGWTFHNKDRFIGQADYFPGNTDLVVSHGVEVPEHLRGQGIGQWEHERRVGFLAGQDLSGILCTVRFDNQVEKHILRKNNWIYLVAFKNKMGEDIELWWRALNEENR